MATDHGNNTSWLDDIQELIRKKQAENVALRKIQDSLQSPGGAVDLTSQPPVDEEHEQSKTSEDQSSEENN